MNRLLENSLLQEIACGTNFAYVLSDNGMFLPTEYKVLQSQANSNFVKCMKMLYNGNLQILYLTDNMKPFLSMIPSLDSDRFMTICANLLSAVIDVKQNGFLSCQNIDVAFDKIFVDPSTYKVSLVYVPVSKRIYDDYATFENEIRTGFVKLISGVANISSPKTMQFAADLANGMMTMEDLHRKSGIMNTPIADGRQTEQRVLRLVALNAPTKVELKVTKNSFVIGKNAGAVDGVISFNKMISRTHCRIDRGGDQYTITDLMSANGTYVNRTRLNPNQPHPIQDGDIVRLANSDFRVKW